MPEPKTAPETTHIARLGDRSLFPHLEYKVYTNHAGISALSVAVTEAMRRVHDDYERRGVRAFGTWLAQRARLKTKLGRLIGARAEDIALTPNTTRGVIDIALCFPWEKGDRVLVFDGEFPSNVTPWQQAAALFGLEIVTLRAKDYLEDPASALDELAHELDNGIRLVASSAVEFQSGFRMPLGEMAALCHARGAELFVDGVQACGIVPLNVTDLGIDYLACGSHKWLMSAEGCGFLYARPGRAEKLRPSVAGWLSHVDPLSFLFRGEGHLRYDRPVKSTIDMVECGNTNSAGFAGLEASVDLLLGLTIEAIFSHVSAYHDALEAGLVGRGFTSFRSPNPKYRSGSLCVKAPAGASVIDLQRRLDEQGIACATPDGFLRFSPHFPNALSEVATILEAVDIARAAEAAQ